MKRREPAMDFGASGEQSMPGDRIRELEDGDALLERRQQLVGTRLQRNRSGLLHARSDAPG